MFVTVGLPVRNAGQDLVGVVTSILAQDHRDFELIISDNASTDDTEEVARELARGDERVRYVRHPVNIGLVQNFVSVLHAARGDYLRWIGDDDRLEPQYLSRVLERFQADPDLLLVTTQISYTVGDEPPQTARYDGTGLGSDDPVDRFVEFLRLLNDSYLVIDPLYGVSRRERLLTLPRPVMLREDEIFAARMALAGRWSHINETLAHRVWKRQKLAKTANGLGVPSWQRHFANTLQAREMARALGEFDLTPAQRARAMAAIRRFLLLRQRSMIAHRSRRLLQLATGRR
jgi:glycosyltransferase involved in cell wall biosynthesis